ncbi:MAG: NADH-quinone oxidoreductase subunit N, partial [Sphingomonadaceae bacterium]|nr:NADH-quinone oxidoreductase subunit N [Sphingomonadaceae bacterium]
YVLAVVGVVASVIGAYYYLRVIMTVYFADPAPAFAPADSRVNTALLAIAALFCSPLGMLAITPLVSAASRAATALF